MEDYNLEEDIPVICVVAESFPDGVKATHQKLHSLAPYANERKYFAISWGKPDGSIHYQAAVNILTPEENNLEGTVPFTIRKGKYQMIIVKNYMQDLDSIGRTFKELLTVEDLDPEGYCLEWYLSDKEVRCMVPLRA
ncbi:MAG TPA: hypothetical protein VMZ69_07575 [Saprospiraceae bacterium]|nr:hypothetical protein [Saprospiraceae bacterium]